MPNRRNRKLLNSQEAMPEVENVEVEEVERVESVEAIRMAMKKTETPDLLRRSQLGTGPGVGNSALLEADCHLQIAGAQTASSQTIPNIAGHHPFAAQHFCETCGRGVS